MEIEEAYETIQTLAMRFSFKIDYYEALFLNNIICTDSLLQSQKIILYMRCGQYESELISNYNSKEELIFLWEYNIGRLAKRSGLIHRIECKKDIKSTEIDTERERFEYAKFLIGEKSNKKIMDKFEWNSECRLYMDIYGSRGVSQNDYFGVYPKGEYQNALSEFFGKSIVDCYHDMQVISDMKRLSNSKHDVEIILLSPQIVSKLLVIPLNQMLNMNNHGECFRFPQIPKCLTLEDAPHSEASIHDILFDLLGNSIENNIYVNKGIVNEYYGEKISDTKYKGNVLMHKNTLKYSMIFPMIKSGTQSIYDIMQLDYMVFDEFIGKIDMWTQQIIGTFVIYDNYQGYLNSVTVNIRYQDFLDAIIEFTQESININRIIACRCPYAIVNKEIIYGK